MATPGTTPPFNFYMKKKKMFVFFSNIFRKLSLTEAIDFLEELDSDDEEICKLYIEPPDIDGDVSGEDDGDEDEGGIPDNVCPAQLKTACELIVKKGNEVDSQDEISNIDDCWISETLEEILNSPSTNDLSTSTDLETVPTSYLNTTSDVTPECPLPVNRRERSFTWIKDSSNPSVSFFPERNFEDCQNLKPHQQFEKFFDDNLIQLIVEKSNEYAIFKGKKNPYITENEFRAFLGILLITGYNAPAQVKNMWSIESDQKNILVSQTMRRDRFKEICSNLHFVGNHKNPNTADKMWKLRPLTDRLKSNMIKNFHPVRDLSYDESMVGYFGKHSCKQFIKGKPLRFGYKVWSLCTSSGYLINFEVYQGQNPRSNKKYEDCFGKCAAPLINMIDEFPNEIKALPYHFYFDNLFTNFPLLEYLKTRGYLGTGTIRENRLPKNCPINKKKDVKKNEKRGFCDYTTAKESAIHVTQWLDNSVVLLASTSSSAIPLNKTVRYSREEKKKISIQRPHVVGEYSKYMGGVDRLDQNVNCYRIGYRGKKWWSSIFTWLLDVCVQNAWQLHRIEKSNMNQLEFRRQIAVYYCKRFGENKDVKGLGANRKRIHEDTVQNTLRYDGIDHLVEPIEKKRRCAGDTCKSIGRTVCGKCDVGLCIKCFASYHKTPI